MKLFMEITRDEFELPIVTADTVADLAKACGVSRMTVESNIWRKDKGIIRFSRYIAVEVGE